LLCSIILCFSIVPITKPCFEDAVGTVYIRADGSIDPPTAPISTADNVTYTFTGDIFGGLDVEKDNVVIDGANYTLQASGYTSIWPTGLLLSGRTNVTIEYVRIETFTEGIHLANSSGNRLFRNIIMSNESDTHPSVNAIILSGSSNNSVCENNITLSISATPEQAGSGILILLSSSNNTISGNTIENTFEGIDLQESSSNYVLGNTIRGNYYGIGAGGANNTISQNNIISGIIGIDLERCWNTIVSGNNITENSHNGITLYPGALNNVLYGNYIASSDRGIILWEASNNSIYYNSFINNTDQVYIIESGYNNSWDNGYPSGGNFWSDYDGGDFYNGPHQNVSGSDGIGDTLYIIGENNTDHYPLMTPYVIPEFPSFLILTLFMIATLLAMAIYKRRILTRAL
jgi:parallel beta-helix repeat protein